VAVLQWFQRVKIVQLRQPSRAVRSSFSRAPQPTVGEIGSITDFRNMSDPNAPVVVEKSAAGGQLLWSADFHPDELEPVDDE
jgi:hypothetical protein